MEEMNAMEQICEYLLSWIVRKQSDAPMSPEVYERAVSIIGTVVPLALFGCGVVAVLLLCCKLFGGGCRGR